VGKRYAAEFEIALLPPGKSNVRVLMDVGGSMDPYAEPGIRWLQTLADHFKKGA